MSVGNVGTSGIFLDQLYSNNQVFQEKSEESEELFSKSTEWSKGKATVTPPADSKISTKSPSLSSKEEDLYELLMEIEPFSKHIQSIDQGIAAIFEDRVCRNYQRAYSQFDASNLERLLLNSNLIHKVLEKIDLFFKRYQKIYDQPEEIELSENAKLYAENYFDYLIDAEKWFKNCVDIHKNEGEFRFKHDIISPTQTSSSSNSTKTSKTTMTSNPTPCLAYTRITKKWEQTLKQRQNSPSVKTSSM
jgi:hypothetical protein